MRNNERKQISGKNLKIGTQNLNPLFKKLNMHFNQEQNHPSACSVYLFIHGLFDRD